MSYIVSLGFFLNFLAIYGDIFDLFLKRKGK